MGIERASLTYNSDASFEAFRHVSLMNTRVIQRQESNWKGYSQIRKRNTRILKSSWNNGVMFESCALYWDYPEAGTNWTMAVTFSACSTNSIFHDFLDELKDVQLLRELNPFIFTLCTRDLKNILDK